MDSLSRLRDSLDSGAAQDPRSQAKLLSDFKSAALHLTALYRTSLSSSKDSFREGYIAALNDLLLTLGERRRVTGTAGSSRGHGGSRGARESADDQLRWFERYLQGRLEAFNEEGDSGEGEDEPAASARMEASHDSSCFPPRRPGARRGDSFEGRGRGSQPPVSRPADRHGPDMSSPAMSPSVPQTPDMYERPTTRLRSRQQTSIQHERQPEQQQQPQYTPTAASSRITASTAAAPGSEEDGNSSTATVPSGMFTFTAGQLASQCTAQASSVQPATQRPGEASGADSALSSQDAQMEAASDAQRQMPGNGNRRSAPLDAGELAWAVAGGAEATAQAQPKGQQNSTPQERKRQKMESEKIAQHWSSMLGPRRPRRDRDREHR